MTQDTSWPGGPGVSSNNGAEALRSHFSAGGRACGAGRAGGSSGAAGKRKPLKRPRTRPGPAGRGIGRANGAETLQRHFSAGGRACGAGRAGGRKPPGCPRTRPGPAGRGFPRTTGQKPSEAILAPAGGRVGRDAPAHSTEPVAPRLPAPAGAGRRGGAEGEAGRPISVFAWCPVFGHFCAEFQPPSGWL